MMYLGAVSVQEILTAGAVRARDALIRLLTGVDAYVTLQVRCLAEGGAEAVRTR